MTKIKLDWFEEIIDTNALKGVYEAEFDIDGKEVLIELCFNDPEECDEEIFQSVREFIKNFENIRQKTYEKIRDDYKNNGEVKRLIEEHLNQFDDEDKKTLGISESMTKEEKINQTFSQVHLKGVGIYPENNDEFAIFDYTINSDITQYLFVVETDNLGHITDDVYIES